MDWSAWILALAGILFGGGMLGQLIMFLIKRHDEKKEREREFYRTIYNKLCEYYSALEILRLNCYKEVHKHVALTEKSHSKANDNLLKIDSLLKTIRSRERKCRKNGKPSSETCDKCNSDRQLVKELYDESRKLQQEASNNLELIDNYWSNNYEQTYSVLTSYANMENFIYAKKGCDKKIMTLIRIIDKATNSMCSSLSFKSLDKWDFEDEMIKQISAISVTLQLISKQL